MMYLELEENYTCCLPRVLAKGKLTNVMYLEEKKENYTCCLSLVLAKLTNDVSGIKNKIK